MDGAATYEDPVIPEAKQYLAAGQRMRNGTKFSCSVTSCDVEARTELGRGITD